MTVIDVHTHMLTRGYLDLLRSRRTHYEVKHTAAGQESIFKDGAPFVTLFPDMWDYPARIRAMDAAKVDLAVVSLTSPNVYFGSLEASLAAARMVNDSMAEAQRTYPDRIRWLASLPWQCPDVAVQELARAIELGAIGVMVLANIDGENLTAPQFAPVWSEINQRALPVLVHPTAPQGVRDLQMEELGLVPPVGFMFDTTLAFARLILAGFLDRYANLSLIAAHGGGALPYLAGRLDRCHEMIPACADVIRDRPSSYLERIYYDAVVYDARALDLCIAVGSPEKVLYGSDYPHNIGDMEGCLAQVDGRPMTEAKRIKSQNAARLFRL